MYVCQQNQLATVKLLPNQIELLHTIQVKHSLKILYINVSMIV